MKYFEIRIGLHLEPTDILAIKKVASAAMYSHEVFTILGMRGICTGVDDGILLFRPELGVKGVGLHEPEEEKEYGRVLCKWCDKIYDERFNHKCEI